MDVRQFFIDELAFIQSVDAENPGDNFNNDPACFANYCKMQMNSCTRALDMHQISQRDANHFIASVVEHYTGA